ncbi:MAG: hypothetical protein SWO11_09410 [Thermodesulfobacteriota bacterium]|nr:hypothetical protein [Thermodesulfobacteriota bacterium]
MWKSRVKEQMRYNFKAEERKNISLAVRYWAIAVLFYYDCWNRLKRSNRDMSSLENTLHPNTTQADKVKQTRRNMQSDIRCQTLKTWYRLM